MSDDGERTSWVELDVLEGEPMKSPDGTPLTPAEWNAERVRRWARLGQQQRSAHPISPGALPLFQRYAEGELSLEEVREGIFRLYNCRPLPRGSSGPEGPEPFTRLTSPPTGEPVVS